MNTTTRNEPDPPLIRKDSPKRTQPRTENEFPHEAIPPSLPLLCCTKTTMMAEAPTVCGIIGFTETRRRRKLQDFRRRPPQEQGPRWSAQSSRRRST